VVVLVRGDDLVDPSVVVSAIRGSQGHGLRLALGRGYDLAEVLLVVLDQRWELVQVSNLVQVQDLVRNDVVAVTSGPDRDPTNPGDVCWS
jgi:hypothetical protein